MAINDDSEKRFESDIESFLLSQVGGYVRNETPYDAKLGLSPARVPELLNPKNRWMRSSTRSTKSTKAFSPKATKFC